MSAQFRKYLIWSAAAILVLIGIALIRGQTSVTTPVSIGS